MRVKPAHTPIIHSVYRLSMVAPTCFGGDVERTHYVTRYNTPIHNILSTAPQLSIYQKALGTLPEDGNVMPKHVGDTMHN
jgi:hypothetical protein